MPTYRPEIGQSTGAVMTPLPLVDEDRMLANILKVQAYMQRSGLAFRPHIKTHKILGVARQQIDAGATGINCQKVSEAEIFADAGFGDILITYNILGTERLARLVALNRRIADLKVVADSDETIRQYEAAFKGNGPLRVLVECDTGGGRCGVPSPEAALNLALRIASTENLAFTGLVTYPQPNGEDATQSFLSDTIQRLAQAGLACPIVSNGGTPSLFSAHLVTAATEHRAGTYVYNDRAMVRAGHCGIDDCAMHVLATVVSRPSPQRAILDAGSKALTSDLLGFVDYGQIIEYPDAVITGLSEEHATVDLSGVAGRRPEIGERIRILPNHTCVVSNLFDHMTFHRNGVVTRVEPVAARGAVW